MKLDSEEYDEESFEDEDEDEITEVTGISDDRCIAVSASACMAVMAMDILKEPIILQYGIRVTTSGYARKRFACGPVEYHTS